MAVPGTGSSNQSLTFAAAKKLAGKAHTSNLKEIYNETIPSNVQLGTNQIFGEDIPQTVYTDTLYAQFSASNGADPTVEYVEFYVQSIAGTTYDANTGSFGDVGFGGGDEAQSSGPHGYQLVLTSSYEASSSNGDAGSGFLVDDQIIHESNGGLQLVNPLFGPQTGNNYGLTLYTAHPASGGLQIPTTSPIEWLVDYYNGTVFVQDYKSTAIPTYARGFIYIGKTAKTLITEASSSGGGGSTNPAGSDTQIQFNDGGSFGASSNLTFDGTNVEITGALSVSGNIGVGIPAGAITHAITLPDNADTTGRVKANAYLTYSSQRFKTDVNVIEKPIETIQNLRGVTFTWKKNNQKDYGFIAEEVGQELPVIVEWDKESPKDNPRAMSMDYTRIIPILLEGIKSQQKQIDDLKQEIKLLKSND